MPLLNKAGDDKNPAIYSKYLVKPPKKKSRKHTHSPAIVKTTTPMGESYVKGKTANGLHEEYQAIDKHIQLLEKRKRAIRKELKDMGIFSTDSSYFKKPFYVYVLRLENDCWYVGISRDVEKRYKKHKKGNGSKWTKKHKPIEIVEKRLTEALVESEASIVEDQVTIEYALKYCAEKVRGGGYSQVESYPRWTQEVLDSESICSHS